MGNKISKRKRKNCDKTKSVVGSAPEVETLASERGPQECSTSDSDAAAPASDNALHALPSPPEPIILPAIVGKAISKPIPCDTTKKATKMEPLASERAFQQCSTSYAATPTSDSVYNVLPSLPEPKPNALLLLNKDCWREVMRRLDNDDYFNCNSTCHCFQHILSDEYEFPSVIWKLRLILPFLIPYLRGDEGRSLLNTRLVCKGWCNVVDNLFDQRSPELRHFRNSFETPEKILEFRMRLNPNDPILNNSLRLKVDPNPIDANSWDRRVHCVSTAQTFMQDFGNAIYKLELTNPNRYLLQHLSSLLPNLKVLSVMGVMSFIGNNIRTPPPDFFQLEKLELRGGVEALGIQHQLRYLVYNNNEWSSREYDQQFPTLKILSLETQQNSDYLEILKWMRSPLEALNIEIGIRRQAQGTIWNNWEINQLLKNVKHLPLKSISIQSGVIVGIEESERISIADYSNSSIENFKIECVGDGRLNEISFNFLQAMPNLKCLEVGKIEQTTEHPPYSKVVNLLDYIKWEESTGKNRPYCSNIWEKVAKLEELKVIHGSGEKSTYRREDYEQFKKIGLTSKMTSFAKRMI